MKVTLYNTSDENNKLSKKLNVVESFNNVLFKDSTSVMNPVLLIKGTPKICDSNYLYIDALKRYYYINDITIESQDIYRVSCSVDVLMSFKSDILKLKGIIGRIGANNRGNFYIHDEKNVREQRTYEITVGSTVKFNTEPTFILTVCGGGD